MTAQKVAVSIPFLQPKPKLPRQPSPLGRWAKAEFQRADAPSHIKRLYETTDVWRAIMEESGKPVSGLGPHAGDLAELIVKDCYGPAIRRPSEIGSHGYDLLYRQGQRVQVKAVTNPDRGSSVSFNPNCDRLIVLFLYPDGWTIFADCLVDKLLPFCKIYENRGTRSHTASRRALLEATTSGSISRLKARWLKRLAAGNQC